MSEQKQTTAPGSNMSLKAAALVGATGLVGKNILTTLLTQSQFKTVTTLTRRPLPDTVHDPQNRLDPVVSSDTQTWTAALTRNSPSIFFSGLGTTRGAAGSLAAQRAIDFDLNLQLARAAKEAGTKVYVLISAAGATSNSWIPYSRMKGELEDAVIALGFEHVVLVRPGFLIGERATSKFGEAYGKRVANALGGWRQGLKDAWAQDGDVVARAAVAAGLLVSEGQGGGKDGVWRLEQADVVRLGRTEWMEG